MVVLVSGFGDVASSVAAVFHAGARAGGRPALLVCPAASPGSLPRTPPCLFVFSPSNSARGLTGDGPGEEHMIGGG